MWNNPECTRIFRRRHAVHRPQPKRGSHLFAEHMRDMPNAVDSTSLLPWGLGRNKNEKQMFVLCVSVSIADSPKKVSTMRTLCVTMG
jgi:hypothetical protein